MNAEQLKHYVNGGKFKATYKPKFLDIAPESMLMIGREIIVHQNMINYPILEVERYVGQHAFNSDKIYGWFPEEDLENLEVIDEHIECVEPLPVYMYRLHFFDQNKIKHNFGETSGLKVPCIVGRGYPFDNDKYVIEILCDPRACKIDKTIWTGVEKYKDLEWNTIYEDPDINPG